MRVVKGKSFYILISLLTLSLLVGAFVIALFFALALFFYCLLFRISSPGDESEFSNQHGILLAPCTGRVISSEVINSEKYSTKIVMKIPWWGPFEIKFPCNWEITQIAKQVTAPTLSDKRWYLTEFKSIDNIEYTLCLTKLSRLSHFNYWIQPGDRGKKAHSLGILLFGGIIELLIPHGHKISIEEGEKIIMGSTVLALKVQED